MSLHNIGTQTILKGLHIDGIIEATSRLLVPIVEFEEEIPVDDDDEVLYVPAERAIRWRNRYYQPGGRLLVDGTHSALVSSQMHRTSVAKSTAVLLNDRRSNFP